MKKFTTNLIVFLTLIILLFQLAGVQAGSFSGIGQIDEDPNIPEEADESITFFDSNDVGDVNDPNLPEASE